MVGRVEVLLERRDEVRSEACDFLKDEELYLGLKREVVLEVELLIVPFDRVRALSEENLRWVTSEELRDIEDFNREGEMTVFPEP
jgi:hypothetical protein